MSPYKLVTSILPKIWASSQGSKLCNKKGIKENINSTKSVRNFF